MNRHRTSIVMLILLLLFSLVAPTFAQDNQWTKPVQVSGSTRSSWFPNLAVGPDESVHIIWSSGVDVGEEAQNGIDLLMYRELRNGIWSPINDIANPGKGGFAVRNSIALGRDGRLHLLMRSQMRIDHISAPWDKSWSARSWSTPGHLNNGRPVYYDALAIDQQATLHALWNESVLDDPKHPREKCSLCADLFYRRSTDGGELWSAPVNISQTPEGSTKPQIKIDQDGHLHVVWSEGYDNINGKGLPVAVMYRYSHDGGATWDPAVRFTLPGDAPQQIALGLFQNTLPLIVYRSTKIEGVYFQVGKMAGKEWSQPTPLPGVKVRSLSDTPWDSYTMSTDGNGNVHLVMIGFIAGDNDLQSRPRLLHLVWNGTSWSAPEIIVIDGLYPEWPYAVISQGNKLHLTWFTRSEKDRYDPDHGQYQVWYSAKTLAAPSVEALPLFTPVPAIPTAKAEPATPAPSPTPLPDEVMQAAVLTSRAAWEAPGLLIVVLALLPVLGLLALVVIIGAKRHHRRS